MGTNFFEFREQVTQPKRKPTGVRPLAGAKPQATGAAGAAVAGALTVTQLTSEIDRLIRAGFPAPVSVRGEVSNYKTHAASGHVYFTLKDAGACLDCVMWKSDAARVKFKPTDGMELLARGNVQVFGQKGKYQLYATSLQPLGQGALELAFQQTKAKLEAEGLFNPERKRPLPMYPSRVVLVTSTQTAALQDIVKVLRRFPSVHVFVYHVPVQGEASGARIAEGLRHISRHIESFGGADVLLLSRGGGSLEDLWGFNEEAVARAIAECPIPVVTGIGHEVDTSIADLVADYHAHTPTEAAQVVTTHWRGARETIDATGLRLRRTVRGMVDYARQRLVGCERHEVFRRPLSRVVALRQVIDDRQRALEEAASAALVERSRLVESRGVALSRLMDARVRERGVHLANVWARLRERHPRHTLALTDQRVDRLQERLEHGLTAVMERNRQRVEGLSHYLEAVSPNRVLQRGYSITTRKKDGAIVRSPKDVKAGERIVTRVADGEIESRVDDANQPRLFE
jgi:exodeoxyribonuclease VII large subunit